jgi:predicted ATPase/DNA-binding SARP family transcriptional activator
MGIEFRILGPLELRADGRVLPLGSPKQRALLALLLVHANETLSRDRLIEELWAEAAPATVESAFHSYLSRLRRLLESAGAGEMLVREQHGYRLRIEPEQLDADRFEHLLSDGSDALGAGNAALAAERLGQALALWRGPPLADVQSKRFAVAAGARLAERRVSALEQRLEADLALGRARELIGELETLVADHPYRERLRAQLMLSLYRSGRQAEALRAYQEARRTLADELGLEPSQELKELEQAILRQDPTLTPDLPGGPEAGVELAARTTLPPSPGLQETSLPTPPTPLIGRERELREAGQLLRAHRIVTLTGPGGSGKTRLALQLADDSVEDFPEGVVWVPLQALRDPEFVLPTIARALGTGETLSEDLRDRRLLLVLDNFEQLLASAPKIGQLSAQLPRLKLLVTSREPLHVGGEYEYAVAPLREVEAVALFVDRAKSVRADFAEDEAVVEICRRLDCLPLALELAAARIKALSAPDLLKRLNKRLPILTGGPQDAPERQRTLRATIAWSHELLTPDEQCVFGRLAVFAGGCTLEAAEEVCQADLDTVAALIDKSLLRREGDRYLMLETIGEYALERLEESGELAALRQQHAEYYLEQARAIEGLIRSPQAAGAIDQLEADYDNLRAALQWLAAETPDAPLRLAVWGLAARLHGFGDQALDRRDVSEARRLYRESLEIGLQLKHDTQMAYCLAGLAAVGALRGRLDQAARLWGSINAFERTSGTPLNDAERRRYERVLGGLEREPDTSVYFADGSAMTLDEAVEYALANVD